MVIIWSLLKNFALLNFLLLTLKDTYVQTNILSNELDKICFPIYGCFSNTDAYSSSLFSLLPDNPEIIDTSFHLYVDSEIRYYFKVTQPFPLNNMKYSNLIVYIHDYFETMDGEWIKNAVEKNVNMNDKYVLVVDWKHGASVLLHRSVANARLVSKELQLVLKAAVENGIESIHLVGLGVGAQIAAIASNLLKNEVDFTVDKITALNPEKTFYYHQFVKERLDKSDAKLVVVLKSAQTFSESIMSSFDSIVNISHYTVHINNPMEFFSCLKTNEDFNEKLRCDKRYVSNVYSKSLELKCNAYQAKGYSSFSNGIMTSCSDEDQQKDKCYFIGDENTPQKDDTSLDYYILTSIDSPFCGNHFTIEIAYKRLFRTMQKMYIKLESNGYSFGSSTFIDNSLKISSKYEKKTFVNFLNKGLYSKSNDDSKSKNYSKSKDDSKSNDDSNSKDDVGNQEEEKFVDSLLISEDTKDSEQKDSDKETKEDKKHTISAHLSVSVPQYALISGVIIRNLVNNEAFVSCKEIYWFYGLISIELESNNDEKLKCFEEKIKSYQ